MLPPTPLSLLCAILLCLPLAAIFTFTTPTSPITSHGGATTSQLPIPTTSSNIISENKPHHILSPPIITTLISETKNQTLVNATKLTPTPPPPIRPPFPPPSPLSQPAENNDDDDDSLLLKHASRVDPNPKPVKKVAFMFLTTSPLPFAPLWEQFFSRATKNSYNIYVHADPKLNYTESFQGVFTNRVIPSKPTRRHSPTLVSAARRLLANALLHDKSNSMFALISPSCIPIHSFNYTYRTLIRYSKKSFIELLKNEPGAYERWAARGEDVMFPDVRYEEFRIGSQFWVVKRKHARVIVNDRRVWSKFKLPCVNNDTCYPDEHYFPTLMSMVDPRGCIPCTLTHVDWRRGHGGHPRTYQASEVNPDLIRALRKDRPRYGDDKLNGSDSSLRRRRHPFLFARKFVEGSLQQLMNMAKDVIFDD